MTDHTGYCKYVEKIMLLYILLKFEERMYGKCSQEKTEKNFQAQTPQALEKNPRPKKKEKVKRPFPVKEVWG
jgi:hypothetical protein